MAKKEIVQVIDDIDVLFRAGCGRAQACLFFSFCFFIIKLPYCHIYNLLANIDTPNQLKIGQYGIALMAGYLTLGT